MVRELQTKRRATEQNPPLWQATKSNGNNLELRQRADRILLLSMTEQSKQIGQWRVFGKLREKPWAEDDGKTKANNHPQVQEAATKAIPLCEQYARGIIGSVEELKKLIKESEKQVPMRPKRGAKVRPIRAKKDSSAAEAPRQAPQEAPRQEPQEPVGQEGAVVPTSEAQEPGVVWLGARQTPKRRKLHAEAAPKAPSTQGLVLCISSSVLPKVPSVDMIAMYKSNFAAFTNPELQ